MTGVEIGNVATLHGCDAETFDGIHAHPVRCGLAATLWMAPSGRTFFVCPEHQEQFANA